MTPDNIIKGAVTAENPLRCGKCRFYHDNEGWVIFLDHACAYRRGDTFTVNGFDVALVSLNEVPLGTFSLTWHWTEDGRLKPGLNRVPDPAILLHREAA